MGNSEQAVKGGKLVRTSRQEGAGLEMNLGTFVTRAVIGDGDMKELTGQVERRPKVEGGNPA